MRYLFIIIFIALVVLIWYRQRLQIVDQGSIYCAMCEDLNNILRETLKPDESDQSQEALNVSGQLVSILYNPKDRRMYFFETKYVLADLETRFEKLKKKEKCFRVADWETIESYHNQVEELSHQVSIEEWKEGLKKFDQRA